MPFHRIDGLGPRPAVYVKIDRPFLLVARNTRTGALHLIGRWLSLELPAVSPLPLP